MVSRRDEILRAAAREIARRGVRGLKVEDVAREAGVSLGLIYYHFTDRAGLLGETFEFVNARAREYVADAVEGAADAREQAAQMLLLELQDDPLVLENSTAWGELRASAIFNEFLREPLRRTTQQWIGHVAETIEAAQEARLVDPQVDPQAAAARLTALVEGLSDRWLSRSLPLEQARELLSGAVAYELGEARVVPPRHRTMPASRTNRPRAGA
jgi:AcrR family transcriptional regulator